MMAGRYTQMTYQTRKYVHLKYTTALERLNCQYIFFCCCFFLLRYVYLIDRYVHLTDRCDALTICYVQLLDRYVYLVVCYVFKAIRLQFMHPKGRPTVVCF